MWDLLDIVIFAAGFAASWFSKDSVTRLLTGSEAFAKTLETKAAALRASF